jgi:hypothetical protein
LRFGLDLLNCIKPASFQLQFHIWKSEEVTDAKSGEYGEWGIQPFCVSPETALWGSKCETGQCQGEAARSVLAKIRGVFACFHAVAVKRRSRTQNSQFSLFGTVLRATTTAV